MDISSFWELIDKAREDSRGDPFKQADLLTKVLAQYPEEDILSYDSILWELMDKAYIADLWHAAYILCCGCSDDGFMDFRAWLIGQGEEIYEKALVNPESLAEVVEPGQQTQVETLLYVATYAYEKKTGEDELPLMFRETPELKGTLLSDELSILARFPKLSSKFWENCKERYK